MWRVRFFVAVVFFVHGKISKQRSNPTPFPGSVAISVIGDLTKSSPGIWEDGNFSVNCLEYRDPSPPYEPASLSGYYMISPANTTQHNFAVYCDMTTDGGGWTAVSGNQIKDQWGTQVIKLKDGICGWDDIVGGESYPYGMSCSKLLELKLNCLRILSHSDTQIGSNFQFTSMNEIRSEFAEIADS